MAATVVPNAIVLDFLNQGNYKEWSFQVKTYLLAEGLWDIVESTAKPPTQEDIGQVKFQAWMKKNAKALHAIQISCGTQMFSVISDIGVAKVAWDTLKESFMRGSFSIGDKRSRSANDDGEPELDGELDGEEQIEAPKDEISTHYYDSFFGHVKRGKWNEAKEYLTQHHDAVRAANPFYGTSVLQEAITKRHGHLPIVHELVELMTEEDFYGSTTFAVAVEAGLTQLVKCMAKKKKKLPTMRLHGHGRIPVLGAYDLGYWDMARYLYSVTPLKLLMPENGCDGPELISQSLVCAKQYDIAWDLLQRCPNLAVSRNYFGHSLLEALAGTRSAFLSGTRLAFWQQWIYNCIYVEPSPPINIDICLVNGSDLEDDNGKQRNHVCSVTGLLRRLVMKLLKLLGTSHIYDKKLKHTRTLECLSCVWKVSGNYDEMQRKFIKGAIFRAVERGHVEFIIRACKANPELLWIIDGEGRNIFRYAICCRQEKAYDLIYRLIPEDQRICFVKSADASNSTILHEAGRLSTKLSQIQGATLQMQRELQWFKELESIVPSDALEVRDFTNLMTARDLFTENHKELVKEGEKSIKETATSCTVVGALIVTIMFAAAFTIPGGSNENTGVPIFLDKKLFMVFIVSDAISLFSSLTSVIIFLGLLTSRYAENDFLTSLPTKMILGLFTLFLSITAMMIAFSSALFIMLHEKSLIIVILVISLSSVPIISFVGMHFSLLVETSVSTYGKGLFDKKVKRWL